MGPSSSRKLLFSPSELIEEVLTRYPNGPNEKLVLEISNRLNKHAQGVLEFMERLNRAYSKNGLADLELPDDED